MSQITAERKPTLSEVRAAADSCGKRANLEAFLKLREVNEICAKAAKSMGIENPLIAETAQTIDSCLERYAL